MYKQIEEMIITAYPIYATMEDSLRKEAIECMNSYTVFEKLYNAGYRKIPEGAVVFIPTEKQYAILTKEEYKTYLAMKSIETNLIEIEKDKARKETAEKFAEQVKMAFYYHFDELIPSIMEKDIDEIAKEITEGKV